MKKGIVLLFFIATVLSRYASAQTWTGSVNSDWNTAGNWMPAGVPGAGSAVTLNNAAAPFQPVLSSDISIASLNMTAGIFNLNGFTITCSGAASFTGDSLLNGKVVANTFNNVANMHMGGKIILEKTGPSNEFWAGNNKMYGDSLIVIWRWGGLHLQSVNPDSIFSHLKIQLADNYSVSFAENALLYVQNDLIIDNTGNGTFSWNSATNNVIGGNLVTLNFSNITTNLILRNITSLGSNANGPFFCNSSTITNCNFAGNFSLVADSSSINTINNSTFAGNDNLIQAGNFDIQNCRFGQTGTGTTILKAAHNVAGNVLIGEGNNKFFNNVQYETYAGLPGSATLQHTFYGQDTCLGNMSFIMKGNSAMTSNSNGNSYVAGNVIIDGQGARKLVQFTGGTGNTFNVGGNFTVKNFTPFVEPGSANTNVYLRNLTVAGTDTCGTFYCTTGDITNSSFNGNFKLIADSSQVYILNNASLLGANNLIHAGNFEIVNSRFGQPATGTTVLKATHNIAANVLVRDGNNKFFNNVEFEFYALAPGVSTFQQTFHGPDTCLGNMSYILKGNSLLTTNGSGNNYVAGNVIIDGQGARKWVQFTGGAGNNFNIGGNFTVKNFTPFVEPGSANTNVYLRNLTVAGTDTCGTFYCTTGDITNSSFNGNFKLIADSSQTYTLINGLFLGANNLFQSGSLDFQNNRFGQTGTGTTILRAAHNVAGNVFMRDGNNKFLGDLQWEGYTTSGSLLIQQTFYGQDSCFGNLTLILSGVTSANLGGNNLYLAKGLSLINNGSGSIIHNTGASAIHFIGTDTADFSFSGSGTSPVLLNIILNRRGGIRLQSPLSFTGGLNFTRGIILSSTTNPLNIPAGAAIAGAWDSSYVDGPVYKTGNTIFDFPLGKNNVYAPISITAPALSTDAFRAQYFNTNAHDAGYDSSQYDPSLNHISRKEYWLLDRTNGTGTPKVTLAWKTIRSGIVNVLPDLRVSRWDGSRWKDEGNGGTTGTNDEGTIQSLNNISSFSPFTLASISINNSLPVNSITFNATLRADRTVSLQWKTGLEVNNAGFEVQRSADGRNWLSIASVMPHLSREYEFIDYSMASGMNYYRIRQVDKDGHHSYSVVKAIRVSGLTRLFIWPNPVKDNLYVQTPFAKGTVEISDMNGRLVGVARISNTITIIPVQQLAKGLYVIRVKKEGEVYTEKFMKE